MTFRSATAIIDCQALVNNFAVVKSLAPHSKVLAVLKANGYGHGLERIAKSLPNADAFGVARIDEALALRAAGITQPIVLLEGFFSPDDLSILAVNDFQTIIHNDEQLEAICQAKLVRPLKVWLKIDTGMHRLGIAPSDFSRYFKTLKQSENVQQPLVLMSHLSCADNKNDPTTTEQLSLFNQLTQNESNEKSLANSAAVYAWPETHFDWIRPGLILYGVSPMTSASGSQELIPQGIAPVMTLQSSLIAIRKLSVGETVGYGSAWQCQKDTIIGVVAIGYGDGYPRHAKNGTPVLINDRRVNIIGRVSMDMITVDLGDESQDKVGDLVTLWGKGLPVEEVALHADTIPYELLCNITRRVKIEVI
jgi:alanine racemase